VLTDLIVARNPARLFRKRFDERRGGLKPEFQWRNLPLEAIRKWIPILGATAAWKMPENMSSPSGSVGLFSRTSGE
jgi:hypothetical protein